MDKHELMKLFQIILAGAVVMLTGCNKDKEFNNEIPNPETPHQATIARVVDYSPAPGQFINAIPEYKAYMSKADMEAEALDMLSRGYAVSLGAYGGSITIELEKPVTNRLNAPDFAVYGNAIDNSSEPGIVYVSTDGKNWFMLSGSVVMNEYKRTKIIYNNPGKGVLEDIKWVTMDGRSGTVFYLPQYNKQPYWPEWIDGDMIIEGWELPSNAVLDPDTNLYKFTPYEGYADSWPNTSDKAWLYLEDAVDPVTLKSVPAPSEVRYIKIVTGMLLMNGPLGESSTEFAGIYVKGIAK